MTITIQSFAAFDIFSGPAASLPATVSSPRLALYEAADTGAIWIWNTFTAAWVQLGGSGGTFNPTPYLQEGTLAARPAGFPAGVSNPQIAFYFATDTGNLSFWDFSAFSGSGGWITVNPPIPAAGNATATAGPTAVNGTATTFMRSDAAPAIQKASATQLGIVQPDGTSITINPTTGIISAAGGGLTSVGVNGDGTVFNAASTNSPLTANGAITLALVAQTPNTFLAGPATGSSAAPTFRAITAADLPTSGPGSGTATNLQVFTTSGTWTKPTSATPKSVDVTVFGGGGGGGGGSQGNLAGSDFGPGGGGGGGGSRKEATFDPATLPATVAVTVGVGGNGGLGAQANASNGANGTAGGNSSFGTLLTAYGGGFGAGSSANSNGGHANGGGGAGVLGAGGNPTTSAPGAAGSFGGTVGGSGTLASMEGQSVTLQGAGASGACSGESTNGPDSDTAVWGFGGNSLSGGAGGGAGGGRTGVSTNPAYHNGGAGGAVANGPGTQAAGGTGAGTTSVIAAGNGSTGGVGFGGGGGGGGACAKDSPGGTGGTGGFPAGGGGGGGAAMPANTVSVGGNGGQGGGGYVVVITTF